MMEGDGNLAALHKWEQDEDKKEQEWAEMSEELEDQVKDVHDQLNNAFSEYALLKSKVQGKLKEYGFAEDDEAIMLLISQIAGEEIFEFEKVEY